MNGFDLKKLTVQRMKNYMNLTISNRFVALQNLDDNVDINRSWETIREKINISAKEGLG
jgi:hypothetical protein